MNPAALFALLPAVNNGWAFSAFVTCWPCRCISAAGTPPVTTCPPTIRRRSHLQAGPRQSANWRFVCPGLFRIVECLCDVFCQFLDLIQSFALAFSVSQLSGGLPLSSIFLKTA
jgi:hypothetical protein